MVVTVGLETVMRIDDKCIGNQVIIAVNGGFISAAEGAWEFISTEEMLEIGKQFLGEEDGYIFVDRLLGLNDPIIE